MQTVVADMSVGSNKNPRGYRGLQRRRPRRLSGIEVQRFKHACRKGYRTYDNQTEDIQLSQGTTYRVSECRVARISIRSEYGKGGLCNKGGYPHEGDGGWHQGQETRMHTMSLRSGNESGCGSTGPGPCKGTSIMYMKPK